MSALEMILTKAKLLALSAAVLFSVSSAVNAQSTLRIAYPTFPPFHWAKANGEMTGFFYEFINEALQKRMGLKVVWTAYPWPRCQENLKIGKEDAIMTVPTAERATYAFTHNDPFYEKPLNLFTYADHLRIAEIEQIKTIEELRERGFSVITYSGNSWHKENVQSLGVKTFETSYLENVWKMLAEKRGDTVIEWPPGAWPDIQNIGASSQIVDTKATIAAMPFHLLIRKDSPLASILQEFNETIKKMRRDGTIELILSKYN